MASFTRVGRLTQGYEPRQVEEFFSRARAAYEGRRDAAGRGGRRLTAHEVRVAAFDLVRRGYDVGQVDAAMDRLEDALARRERQRLVQRSGQEAVATVLRRRAKSLRGRLARPDGERFDRGRGLEPGYHPGEVDALCHRLHDYFEQREEMSADDVRRAVFRMRRGSRGYREAQVDAFLDRAIEIMVAVD